jgi:hypothetical protein
MYIAYHNSEGLVDSSSSLAFTGERTTHPYIEFKDGQHFRDFVN